MSQRRALRNTLRSLSRYQRDRLAESSRSLAQQLEELERREAALERSIETMGIAVGTRFSDAFERSAHDRYLTSLRDQLQSVRLRRDQVQADLHAVREDLERSVVEHRKMDHMVETFDRRVEDDRQRREEQQCDDLISGQWRRVRVEESA